MENMTQLLTLIRAGGDAPFEANALEIAELHRELGQFDAAALASSAWTEDYYEVSKQVIDEQIAQRCTSPIRYRM